MLSIGKLAPGRQQYYLDTVAAGVEDYYTGSGEAPGQWLGSGSERLGLTGEVDAAHLQAVLDGRDPHTGEALGRAPGKGRVPGFDLTFCAPKSVSILFALGDPAAVAEIREAHDAAVASALRLLEDETCVVRRGHAGAKELTGDGFVAAGFRHRTSRAAEPHLHTHVLIANMAHAPVDDRWTALHARPVYHWAKTAGYVYSAELRGELTRRLGLEWGPVVNGMADLEGVPQPLVRALSSRRRDIEAAMEDNGVTGGRAAQVAAYATRTRKVAVNLPDLIPQWSAIAAAHGLDAPRLADLTSGVGRHEPALPDTKTLFSHLAGPEGLAEHRSHFGRKEVIEAIAAAMPQGADAAHITATADTFLQTAYAVALDPPGFDPERVEDAEAARAASTRWTTADLLATERHLLELVARDHATTAGVVNTVTLEQVLTRHPELSGEQRRMVENVTRSGNTIDLVEGAAGAGKTMALRAAAQAWDESRQVVVGAALSARAARQLQDGSGIQSATLDRLLNDLDRPDTSGLTGRHVVVVDEAAMVGTRKLTRLLDHADAAGAKVVLVGDPHQLPEIEAGGAFAALAQRLDPSHLVDNRRQVEGWERAMLADLRSGDTSGIVGSLEEHDRLHVGATPDDARTELVHDWLAARTQGSNALMLAPRQSEVDQLNDEARAMLQRDGLLGPDAVEWFGRRFAVGDEVVALRNDYRLGVLNGTRGVIAEIDPDAGQFTITSDENEQIVMPTAYAEAGLLTHGYAVTIHKAQGLTVDRALILGEGGFSREHAYTALSRGIERNDLYLATADPRVLERHLDEVALGPVDALRAALQRSSSETLAIEQLSGVGFDRGPAVDEPELDIGL